MRTAKLTVFLQDSEQEILLDKESITIGRGRSHNPGIIINDPTVSRLHARIFVRDERYFLEDLSTFQRTFLNSSSITRATELKDQDILQFGNIKAKFALVSEEEMPEEDETGMLFSESGTDLVRKFEESRDGEVVTRRIKGESPTMPFRQMVREVDGATQVPLSNPQPDKPNTAAAVMNSDEQREKEEQEQEQENMLEAIELEEKSSLAEVFQEEDAFQEEEELRMDSVSTPEASIDTGADPRANEERASESPIAAEAIIPQKEASKITRDEICEEGFDEEEDEEVEEAFFSPGETGCLTVGELPFATPITDKYEKSTLASTPKTALACLTTRQILPLQKEVVYIGNDGQNDLAIPSNYFAKVQFSIICNKSGKYYLKHLGVNETRVNGEVIDNVIELNDGMSIAVGEHLFHFFNSPATTTSPHPEIEKFWEDERGVGYLPDPKQRAGSWKLPNMQYDYKIICKKRENSEYNSDGFVLIKVGQEETLLFFGEIYQEQGRKFDELGSYIVKLQGILEAVSDYVETPLLIVEALNRNIYRRFGGAWISGTLLLVESKEIKWVSAAAPPMIFCSGHRSYQILSGSGSPLGMQEIFHGREHSILWEEDSQILLFSRTLFHSPLASDSTLLVSVDSIKRLFKGIHQKQQGKEAWDSLEEALLERVDIDNPFIMGFLRKSQESSE